MSPLASYFYSFFIGCLVGSLIGLSGIYIIHKAIELEKKKK